ncbi:hypothetical protein PR003_g9667 [Phytophthora rubi]|uniref:Uncharacterized protein n=1 Tax=Phytophthora rubi TaxID=129364 RepID=A0A6A3MHB3_9STRA|nr:hypothetical protein PR002_g9467 [Phytophthora rubi]KAE9034814.1 hypothetical protein PR001_g9571 [Phytophthora rubi]KAE9342059.1 hypothetical protein PR003_g9667 [Phytophthora rubi]
MYKYLDSGRDPVEPVELPTVPVSGVEVPSETADVTMDYTATDGVDGGDIDDVDLYLPMHISPDAAPQRRHRLRLCDLQEADKIMGRLGATLAAKIADVEDWSTAVGYTTASRT